MDKPWIKHQLAGLAIGVSQPSSFRSGRQLKYFQPLPQVVRDVELLRKRIQTIAQVANKELLIPPLTGRRATRAAILQCLEDRLSMLQEGGLFIFILEGHGTNVADSNGDEAVVDPKDVQDEAFPTADEPIVDDTLWQWWNSRPDISVFTIADTCSSESSTVRYAPPEELRVARALGAIIPKRELRRLPPGPIIHTFECTGPSILQFGASVGVTEAVDIPSGSGLTGRFTSAIIQASTEHKNLISYRSWFTEVDKIVRADSHQVPVLFYSGPHPEMIDERPAFVPANWP